MQGGNGIGSHIHTRKIVYSVAIRTDAPVKEVIVNRAATGDVIHRGANLPVKSTSNRLGLVTNGIRLRCQR